jgi:transcription elongation factor Elf1
MARRRKSKTSKPVKYKMPKLDIEFACPLCNYDKSVTSHRNNKDKVLSLTCRICGIYYNARITNTLLDPIDVYSEWIDKFKEIKKHKAGEEIKKPQAEEEIKKHQAGV